MRGSICAVIALVAVAGLAPPMLGQLNNINNPDPQKMPEARSKAQPGTAEQRVKTVLTRAEGSTAGGFEERRVAIGDSQGRLLLATTRMEKGAAIGATMFILDDHATGTRTEWSTENNHAKMQKFPEGVPGRSSCWETASEEQTLTRWWGASPFGFSFVTCRPAEEHYCDPWGAVLSTPVNLPGDGSSVVRGTYADCRESLSGPPKQDSERKDEDLGIEKILGFETHGCRVTFKNPEGTIVDEKWVAEFGLQGSRKPIVLRSVYESPWYGNSDKLTAKTRIEMTSLSLEEPASTNLQPPKDYTIEPEEMHEVPCEQSAKPPQ